MFQRNPVKTEKGIFRRDISGNWWELEILSLPKHHSRKNNSGRSHSNKLTEIMASLEGPVVLHDSEDESTLVVKGWKKISDLKQITEIEKSVNSGRTVLELDFI
jgi:hypothetical protein